MSLQIACLGLTFYLERMIGRKAEFREDTSILPYSTANDTPLKITRLRKYGQRSSMDGSYTKPY